LFHWAELGFENGAATGSPQFSYKLWSITGIRFDQYLGASSLDYPISAAAGNSKGQTPGNFSKWLLWQDPLRPLYEPCYRSRVKELELFFERQSDTFLAHYSSCQKDDAVENRSENLLVPALISSVIVLKLKLRRQLVECQTLWRQVKKQMGKVTGLASLMDIEQSESNHHHHAFIHAWDCFKAELVSCMSQTVEVLARRLKSLYLIHRTCQQIRILYFS
jgi:hypothetical protein